MMTGGRAMGATGAYAAARPGHQIRTLVASANILAKTGNGQACESVLAAARTLHTRHAADLRDSGVSWAEQPGWRQREIAAAQPVTGKDISFQYDQLLDAEVVNPGNETLDSVQDLATNPQTGKIAYVVISQGGLFGIGSSYTSGPWKAFEAASDGSFLILDTTRAVLEVAPQGRGD